MKKKMQIVGLLIVFCIVLSFSLNGVLAYSIKPWTQGAPSNIQYKWGASLKDGNLKNGWKNAISSWKNETDWGIQFVYNKNSNSFLTREYDTNKRLYGHIINYYDKGTGIASKFKGYLNEKAKDINKSSVAKSTALHELGHALGLGHSKVRAIMNSNRDREKVKTPQRDDMNGIKVIYPNLPVITDN